MLEACWYEKLPGGKVRCGLCPHRCLVKPDRRGLCRVRENVAGVLYTRNYGLCTGAGMDPVEKKPLYHFFPGSQIFSVGTLGCSFGCEFCQNWEIAHGDPPTVPATPADLVAIVEREASAGCIGIAYTYSEPLVWYEFVLETAALVRRAGYKNVLVTNGFIQPDPLRELLPYLDALNIDVKGFSPKFYRRFVHGTLEPVLRTAEMGQAAGCHLELTTLLVPGFNDAESDLIDLVSWVEQSLGKDVPLHFSRYFPHYKMKQEPTPLVTMYQARSLALAKLNYVYLGNVPGVAGADTLCPDCGELLIQRRGWQVTVTGLNGDQCSQCGREIAVVTRNK